MPIVCGKSSTILRHSLPIGGHRLIRLYCVSRHQLGDWRLRIFGVVQITGSSPFLLFRACDRRLFSYPFINDSARSQRGRYLFSSHLATIGIRRIAWRHNSGIDGRTRDEEEAAFARTGSHRHLAILCSPLSTSMHKEPRGFYET